LMDSVRAGKDAGGSVLKVMQTYYGIRNIARESAQLAAEACAAEATADIESSASNTITMVILR